MISVCMATYNGEKYVLEQLSSILPQLGDNDELIISDDLSIDRTLKLIEGLEDVRIKIHLNKLPNGYSKNFENALSKAKGDIVFIADQDDVWYPNKVKKMIEALDNADMVVSDATGFDGELNLLYPSHFRLNGTSSGFMTNFLRTRYIGACMAFRRSVLQKALPLPANSKLCAYDYWLAIIGEYYFKVELVKEPLLMYRRHGGNASSGGVSSDNSFFRKLIIRLYSLQELLKRK